MLSPALQKPLYRKIENRYFTNGVTHVENILSKAMADFFLFSLSHYYCSLTLLFIV